MKVLFRFWLVSLILSVAVPMCVLGAISAGDRSVLTVTLLAIATAWTIVRFIGEIGAGFKHEDPNGLAGELSLSVYQWTQGKRRFVFINLMFPVPIVIALVWIAIATINPIFTIATITWIGTEAAYVVTYVRDRVAKTKLSVATALANN